MLGSSSGKPLCAEGKRREGRLEKEAAVLPFGDRIALHDAVPAANLVIKSGADPAGRMDPQIATQLIARRPVSGAQQELRGPERSPGEDHSAPRVNGERPGAAVETSLALDPGGTPMIEDQPFRLDLGPHPRAVAHRPG